MEVHHRSTRCQMPHQCRTVLSGLGKFVGLAVVAASIIVGSTAPAHAQQLTYIRLLNAVVNGPKIDFHLNREKKLNDQTYGDISKYLRMPNGQHRFEVRASENPTFSPLVQYHTSYGQFFTVVPYGTVADPRLLVLRETRGKPMRRWMNYSRVFVCHLSPGLSAINVRVGYNNQPTRPFIRSLSYGQVKSAYAPAGTAMVRIRVGTNTIRTIQVNMRPGRRHTMFLIGKVGATGKSAFRVIHEDAASQ